MIRPVYEVLGHIAHGRIEMEGLKALVVSEMQSGFRPTHRGHEWSREHFDLLEAAGVALEVSWHLMKALQFSDSGANVRGRLEQARSQLRSLPLPSNLEG